MSKLIPPSRCTGSLPRNLNQEHLIAEIKLDGSRYVLYIGDCDPYERSFNALLSRRLSSVDKKHVDKTKNVPHITDTVYEGLEGTVLDGEMFKNNFLETQSIMGASHLNAIKKQEEVGKVYYFVWDVPVFKGKDIRNLPLEQRRKVLKEVVKRMDNPYIKIIPSFDSDITENFNRIVEAGGEGLIIKDLRMSYGIGWSKMKKSYDVSCIITSFNWGKGSFKDLIGSINLGVYKNGKIIEIGSTSGFDLKTRKEITANWDHYKGTVCDVFAQEVLKTNREISRLRHPSFHRFRNDMEPELCTFEKLKSDLKDRVKSFRRKEE